MAWMYMTLIVMRGRMTDHIPSLRTRRAVGGHRSGIAQILAQTSAIWRGLPSLLCANLAAHLSIRIAARFGRLSACRLWEK